MGFSHRPANMHAGVQRARRCVLACMHAAAKCAQPREPRGKASPDAKRAPLPVRTVPIGAPPGAVPSRVIGGREWVRERWDGCAHGAAPSPCHLSGRVACCMQWCSETGAVDPSEAARRRRTRSAAAGAPSLSPPHRPRCGGSSPGVGRGRDQGAWWGSRARDPAAGAARNAPFDSGRPEEQSTRFIARSSPCSSRLGEHKAP